MFSDVYNTLVSLNCIRRVFDLELSQQSTADTVVSIMTFLDFPNTISELQDK